MASAKLFGCAINVEAEEEGGRSIAQEVSLSGIQPDDEAMSLFVSNSDSGSASMDSEPDLRNCFINFFDREQYEVEAAGDFYITPNQRVSSSGEFDIWGYRDTEEEIELGLRIGSGSGQLRSDSGGDRETDSGRVVGTGLTLVGGNLVSQEEDMEWEDMNNLISLVQEPVEVSLLQVVEESSLASRDDDDDDDQSWQVLLFDNNFGFFEESAATMVELDTVLMDFEYGFFQDNIDEFGENNGIYNAVIGQMFDNESGIRGSPPASKSIVVNLPVVEITSEELRKGNIFCAICKDEIVVEEKVKRLPCKHYYHGECIIPWLGIRNTCPVCRYELPTDDLDYERRNRTSQRRGGGSSGLGR